MRKRHKKVRNGVVALTLLVVTGLFFGGQKIKALTKEVEYKVSVEKVAVAEKQSEVEELQAELDNMDSPEYIKKVASEELKMVEKDTIVFRAKE